MRNRGIDEKEKEEFNQNPFSRTSDRYTERRGLSGNLSAVWKKLPFKIKLFIIGGLGAILVIFMITVALISIEPFDFLDFSNETKTKVSNDENDTSDYAAE